MKTDCRFQFANLCERSLWLPDPNMLGSADHLQIFQGDVEAKRLVYLDAAEAWLPD